MTERLFVPQLDAALEADPTLSALPKTRREAQTLGVSSYFTGSPCRNGHLAKRYTNTGSCQECIQERNREFRAANPLRTRELDKSRRTRRKGVDRRTAPRGAGKNQNPFYRLLWLTRSRSSKDGIPCDLTEDDIDVLVERAGGCCEVTGISFDTAIAGNGARRPYTPSLDRIDSHGPYTLANMRLVCTAVNIALGDFGEDVFARIAEAYVSRKKGGK